MILVEAKDLSYKLGNRYILKNINFQVCEGENWIVLGLNGSGKTSLLSLLAQYLPSPPDTIQIHAKTEFVSDAFFSKYYKNETMFDVVLSGYTKTLGVAEELTNEEIRQAKRILRLFGVGEKARKPFSMLSKGERQKTLIARALVSKPQLIFLDEPFSGLDVYARNYTMHILNHIAKEYHISFVCVTHYFDEITSLYNKALLIKDGQIHSQGELKKIITTENISDFFKRDAEIIYTTDGIELKMHEETLFDKSLLWQ